MARKKQEIDPAATQAAIAWIRGILDEKQISGTKLATMAGLAASTVLRMINDENHRFTPSLSTMQAISRAVQKPIPENLIQIYGIPSLAAPIHVPAHEATKAEARRQEDERRARAEEVAEERRIEEERKAFVSSSDSGVFKIRVRPVSSLPKTLQPALKNDVRVPCPPQLAADRTAFAFYMPDTSMMPFIRGGTLMYASKQRDPVVGDLVLILDEAGRAKVRLVKELDSDGVHLEKAGAFDSEEILAFDEIAEIAVVVGTWRL